MPNKMYAHQMAKIFRLCLLIVLLLCFCSCTAHHTRQKSQQLAQALVLAPKTHIDRKMPYVFSFRTKMFVAYPTSIESLDLSPRAYYQLYQVLKQTFAREFPYSVIEPPLEDEVRKMSIARREGASVYVKPVIHYHSDQMNSHAEWQRRMETEEREKIGTDKTVLVLEVYDSYSEQLIDLIHVKSRSSVFTHHNGAIDALWLSALRKTLALLSAS